MNMNKTLKEKLENEKINTSNALICEWANRANEIAKYCDDDYTHLAVALANADRDAKSASHAIAIAAYAANVDIDYSVVVERQLLDIEEIENV